jgi:hypothetical protein
MTQIELNMCLAKSFTRRLNCETCNLDVIGALTIIWSLDQFIMQTRILDYVDSGLKEIGFPSLAT